MARPTPITLTQVSAEDFDGPYAPAPYVVVGSIPGTDAEIDPQEAPEIDAEPADVDALAAQVQELVDALIAAGVLTAP